MRRIRVWVAVVVCGAAAACSSNATTAPSGSTAAPVVTPVSQSSDPSSATPSPPTKTEDAANLKRALVRDRDLGRPWVQPKAVSTVKGKKGEICPGHVSATLAIPVIAEASVNFTEGRGAGKNIASYSLRTLPAEDDRALVVAYQKDQKACATYQDSSGLFVVRSIGGPSSIDGAVVIATWTERIYYDKPHQKLAYARHYLIAREGRVVTSLGYAFLTVKKDPDAKDFNRAKRLLEVQLAKNAKVFS